MDSQQMTNIERLIHKAMRLGLNSYVTNASDDVVGGGFSFFDGHDFHRVCGVVGAQDEMAAGDFHVLHGAGVGFEYGVHVGFIFAVGFE